MIQLLFHHREELTSDPFEPVSYIHGKLRRSGRAGVSLDYAPHRLKRFLLPGSLDQLAFRLRQAKALVEALDALDGVVNGRVDGDHHFRALTI